MVSDEDHVVFHFNTSVLTTDEQIENYKIIRKRGKSFLIFSSLLLLSLFFVDRIVRISEDNVAGIRSNIYTRSNRSRDDNIGRG